MAIPTKNSLLVPYVTNFNERLTATPVLFGLLAADATALDDVVQPYLTAAQAASVEGNRSPALISTRNSMQAAMMPVLRDMYGRIQANSAVADSDKLLIGVTVRAAPTPQPIPSVEPAMDVISVNGHRVRVRLHDAAGDGKRSKPAGVKGATVMSYHGPNPENPSLYRWEGNTNRSIFEVEFPDTLAPGTPVYLAAMWLNERGQNGPACVPVVTYIQFPGVVGIAA